MRNERVWCAGANRVDTTRLAVVDTTRLAECSALTIKDTPANPVELLKLDALGSIATLGGVETSTADEERRGAMDAGLHRHVLKEPAVGCVKGQGATEASHGRALSNVIAANET